MNLGITELLIILAIILLIFGSTQLPKLARSLGQAKREFEREDDRVVVTERTVVVPKPPVTDLSDRQRYDEPDV